MTAWSNWLGAWRSRRELLAIPLGPFDASSGPGAETAGAGAVPPEVLFKYLPPVRVGVLRNRLLRYSQPTALNDPAEGTVPFFAPSTPTTMFASPILSAVHNALSAMRENNRRFLDPQIGILSLAEPPDSTLMWSHYAESHSGFVVGFDSNHSYFRDIAAKREPWGRLWPVEYRRFDSTLSEADSPLALMRMFADAAEAVKWALEIAQAPPQNGQFARRYWASLYFTKAVDWSYEREWRILERVTSAVQTIPGEPDPVCLYEFPPAAIRQVIVGARTSAHLRDEIRECLREPSLSHVTLKTASLGERDGRVRLDEAAS
jgi:hypothetical protein